MNTQHHTRTAPQPLPVAEDLVDIPSEFIMGSEVKKPPTLNEFSLSDQSKRLIFDSFRKKLKDIDNEEYEVEWGVYTITGVHHYEAHEEQGGDSYMGFCETYMVIDRDEIEITSVYDTAFECERPTLPGILNAYFKREKLQYDENTH